MIRLWSNTIKLLFATVLAQSVAFIFEKVEASEITRDEMLFLPRRNCFPPMVRRLSSGP